MKRILKPVFFLMAVLMAACSTDKTHFRLEGKIDNIDQSEFYIYSPGGDFDGMDTIRVKGGRFTYERAVESDMVLALLFSDKGQLMLVAEPGTTARLRGNATRLGEAEITGTDANDMLSDLRNDMLSGGPQQTVLKATHFIRSHKESPAATAVFLRYLANPDEGDANTTREMLDLLVQGQPKSTTVANLKSRLMPLINTAKGRKLPKFSLPLLDGGQLESKDCTGQPLLFVFWAQWSSSSYAIMREAHKMEKRYAPHLKVIYVNIDADRQTCRTRARRDTLGPNVVFDGEGPTGPASTTLGMRSTTEWFVCDRQGRITTRDTRTETMQEAIEQACAK